MLLYRIVSKKYADRLFSSGLSGRWNTEGKRVIYTAGSISLAIMENMIRRNGAGFNKDFSIMFIEVPDTLPLTEYTKETLPVGWNAPRDYSISQSIGDQWYEDAQTLLLKAPSAIVPQEYNYVLNTLHPDFTQVQLVAVTPFIPDERIDELLKKGSPEK